MKRCLALLAVVLALFILACNLTRVVTTTPTERPATEIATQTPANLLATDTPPAQPPVPIVYYYFVAIEGQVSPCGKRSSFAGSLCPGADAIR